MENADKYRIAGIKSYKAKGFSGELAQNLLFLFPSLVFTVSFIYLLKTSFYMYFFYAMAGLLIFLVSQKTGKLLYLYLVLLMTSVSSFLNKPVYNLHYYDNDGLNMLGLHPINIILIVALIFEVAVLVHSRSFKLNGLSLFGVLTVTVFAAVTFLKRGFNGFPIIFSNYLGPILLMIFYDNIKEKLKREQLQKLLSTYLIVAFFIGVFGLFEYALSWNPLKEAYEAQGWGYHQQTDQYRIMTLLGHPLDNAFYFLSAMAIVNQIIKDRRLKYTLLLFFTTIILVTGSRSFFVLAILILIFDSTHGAGTRPRDIVPRSLAVLMAGILFLTPLGNTVMRRMNTVEGQKSTEARIVLAEYLVNNYKSFNIRGIGASSRAIRLVDSTNHSVILENPWIILFVDVSYLIIFYITFLFHVFRKTSSRWGLYMLLLALSSSNSFGVRGEANFLFFLVLIANILWTWIKVNEKQVNDEKL